MHSSHENETTTDRLVSVCELIPDVCSISQRLSDSDTVSVAFNESPF